MKNGTLHRCFAKAKLLLEKGDKNRDADRTERRAC